jgi:hypothetical protein
MITAIVRSQAINWTIVAMIDGDHGDVGGRSSRRTLAMIMMIYDDRRHTMGDHRGDRGRSSHDPRGSS